MQQAPLFGDEGPKQGEIERWCREQGLKLVIGVDEAGRGPLAGPVHAAAVALDPNACDADWLEDLDDSKKMTEAARERVADAIRENAVAWAIAVRSHDVIDDVNILQATIQAMTEAIEAVASKLDRRVDRVFVDGNQPVPVSLPQQALVKGDARSLSIAAASVLAKTSRDEMMRRAHERWPEYNFASNKGYGSREHREAIVAHGPCAIHRLSFGGVREHAERMRDD
jgi:ribonuclease HII